MFKYKDKKEFLELDLNKRCYYLARLYLNKDNKPSKTPYTNRLFSCLNYLKKQPEPVLSILYNYLSENRHNGEFIWKLVPKAVLFDQQERRKGVVKVDQEEFNEKMLDDVLEG